MKSCLIVVDIQNDFLPGGALGVEGADTIVPTVNGLVEQFDHTVACVDWHPKNHGSFAATHNKKVGDVIKLKGLSQILWPVHCVQETKGAEFAPGLTTTYFEKVFQKGVDTEIDSYGAFFDNGHKRDTGLDTFLKEKGVGHLFVVGLTTDYCVKYTVLDGLKLGYKVSVILDACKAVNFQPGDEEAAIEEMKREGASILTSFEFP